MAAPSSPRDSLEEGAPLLSPIADGGRDSSLEPEPTAKPQKPWLVFVILIFFLIAVLDVGGYLSEAPKTRVYEANICLHYYETNDPSKIENGAVPERLCKVDEVQQRMAMIFGWQDMFDALPGILLAVPYGALADKWGRKWVFLASLMGVQLGCAWVLLICYFRSLPLQLTWFSSAFFFVGGGSIVASAVALTMISDVVPPEKRTAIFLYLSAAVLIAELVAPIMAAQLMKKGDWYPLLLALVIQQVGIFLTLFLPETLHLRDLPEPIDPDDESIELRNKRQGHGLRAQLRHFKDAVLFLRSDVTLAIVIFTFLVNRLGRQTLSLLIRYASKRYNWEIRKAGYLLSFRAATNLVAMTVVIPAANYALLRFLRLPAHTADVWITRGSLILVTLAFLVMAVAAHPVLLILGLLVYNLGTGYTAALRSIAIHVVGGQSSPNVGKLMSLIAISESLGSMFAGPILNGMFQWGMDMGQAWLGLPFLGTCFGYGLMTIVMFMINVKDQHTGHTEVDSETEDESEGIPRGSTSALEHETPRQHI